MNTKIRSLFTMSTLIAALLVYAPSAMAANEGIGVEGLKIILFLMACLVVPFIPEIIISIVHRDRR